MRDFFSPRESPRENESELIMRELIIRIQLRPMQHVCLVTEFRPWLFIFFKAETPVKGFLFKRERKKKVMYHLRPTRSCNNNPIFTVWVEFERLVTNIS
jgi:hypothetical protein